MDLKPAIGVKVTTQNGRLALPIVRRPRIVILPDLNVLPSVSGNKLCILVLDDTGKLVGL